MPVVSCYLDSPRQTVDFPRFIDGVQGSRDNTCAAKLCFAFFFPFPPSLFCRFLSSNTVQLDSLFTKMLTTCTYLSVKFVFSLNIGYKGPELRENLQSTIFNFCGFKNRKQTCKSFHNNSAKT